MKIPYYPALVTNVYDKYVEAAVQVGKVELTLPFPRLVMAHHQLLETGSYFSWYPSKDGSVRISDIQPNAEANRQRTERELKEIAKSLERLCNPEKDINEINRFKVC